MGALALAPVSVPLFFFIGFAAFIACLRGAPTRRSAFFYSWLYALGFHVAGLYWISAALFTDIARYFWALPLALLALPSYLALLFAAAATLIHGARQQPLIHALLLAPLLFASELLRGWLFTGFPWNMFGYIWTGHDSILQSTSLIGIEGLTFLTLLAGCALSLVFAKPGKASLLLIILSWAALGGLSLWGIERLQATATYYYPDIHLRLVQPAITQAQRRTHALRVAAFNKTIALSMKAAEKPVTHILWAETASPFFLAQDESARAVLRPIIPKGGALITGMPARTEPNVYYNSLAALDDQGAVVGVYDKAHLVPFGEFIPFRSTLKLMPLAADVISASDFYPGPGPKTVGAPGLPPFSPMICYEAIFSGRVIDAATDPTWLLQITNDAWFGTTSGPYQHLAMARVRAIEEGLPLVRVANAGISAVVDATGRITTSLKLNEEGVLDADLPMPLTEKTLFSKTHGWPSRILAAICILAGLALMLRRVPYRSM